jgi:hypothetical protein
MRRFPNRVFCLQYRNLAVISAPKYHAEALKYFLAKVGVRRRANLTFTQYLEQVRQSVTELCGAHQLGE